MKERESMFSLVINEQMSTRCGEDKLVAALVEGKNLEFVSACVADEIISLRKKSFLCFEVQHNNECLGDTIKMMSTIVLRIMPWGIITTFFALFFWLFYVFYVVEHIANYNNLTFVFIYKTFFEFYIFYAITQCTQINFFFLNLSTGCRNPKKKKNKNNM